MLVEVVTLFGSLESTSVPLAWLSEEGQDVDPEELLKRSRSCHLQQESEIPDAVSRHWRTPSHFVVLLLPSAGVCQIP